jgi:CheY-like chemotaxis protein
MSKAQDQDVDRNVKPESEESTEESLWNLIRLDGIKVLVVEDVLDSRILISRILERAGAHVLSAESVEEARAFLAATRPDVIVSDIAMPDEDGLSFIRRLREDENIRNDHIPALALTAFTDQQTHNQILKAGFEVHVPKASGFEVLLGSVRFLAATQSSSVH